MKYIRAMFNAFDAADLPVFMLILAVVLIAYGASHFHDGLGAIVAGVLLLIYVRPLSRWYR